MAFAHVPPGWPSVIPRLFVENPEEAVRFIKEVFDADGEFNGDRPSELRIGDSLLMIGSTFERAPTFSLLYVYVPDVDAAYRKALGLGATSIELPAEMPYGDRRAMVEDPWGNQWQLAQHRRFGGADT
jgi:PhnB protein